MRVPLYRVVFECMYYSGLRIGEAMSLTVDCVDAAHKTLRVVGKGNKERLAPLSEGLYRDLRQAWSTHRTRPWLFPNRRRTGPVNVHTLQEQGLSSETVGILLGHSSVETTKRYLHLLEASSDKVSGALDSFCKSSMR